MRMEHPTLKSFKFCPGCGSPQLTKNDMKKIVCNSCDLNLYLNPAAAVSLVLYNEKDEFLIATRAHNPGINLFDLPGGFIDPFETAETAAIREIKEELNIDINKLEYISTEVNVYLYKNVEYQTVDIGYACLLPSSIKMVVDPELKKVDWIHYRNLRSNEFAFPSAYKILQDFCKLKYQISIKG